MKLKKSEQNSGDKKRPIVDSAKTLYATNSKNCLSITRISQFWTALKMSWLKRFTSSRSFWVTLKNEWLADFGLTGLVFRNTNSIQVDLICKNCPNPFWKNVYTGFRICVENYLKSLYTPQCITIRKLSLILPLWSNLGVKT